MEQNGCASLFMTIDIKIHDLNAKQSLKFDRATCQSSASGISQALLSDFSSIADEIMRSLGDFLQGNSPAHTHTQPQAHTQAQAVQRMQLLHHMNEQRRQIIAANQSNYQHSEHQQRQVLQQYSQLQALHHQQQQQALQIAQQQIMQHLQSQTNQNLNINLESSFVKQPPHITPIPNGLQQQQQQQVAQSSQEKLGFSCTIKCEESVEAAQNPQIAVEKKSNCVAQSAGPQMNGDCVTSNNDSGGKKREMEHRAAPITQQHEQRNEQNQKNQQMEEGAAPKQDEEDTSSLFRLIKQKLSVRAQDPPQSSTLNVEADTNKQEETNKQIGKNIQRKPNDSAVEKSRDRDWPEIVRVQLNSAMSSEEASRQSSVTLQREMQSAADFDCLIHAIIEQFETLRDAQKMQRFARVISTYFGEVHWQKEKLRDRLTQALLYAKKLKKLEMWMEATRDVSAKQRVMCRHRCVTELFLSGQSVSAKCMKIFVAELAAEFLSDARFHALAEHVLIELLMRLHNAREGGEAGALYTELLTSLPEPLVKCFKERLTYTPCQTQLERIDQQASASAFGHNPHDPAKAESLVNAKSYKQAALI